jgi:hypothetical protein
MAPKYGSIRYRTRGVGGETVVLWIEVEVMHGSGKMFGSFQLALHKCFIDDHFRGHVREFTSLPGLHLLSHRLEVSLHPINTDRNAVDQRKRLRVFG